MRRAGSPPLALLEVIAGLEAILVEIDATLCEGPSDAYSQQVLEKVRELAALVTKWKRRPPKMPLQATVRLRLLAMQEQVAQLRADVRRQADGYRATFGRSSN